MEWIPFVTLAIFTAGFFLSLVALRFKDKISTDALLIMVLFGGSGLVAAMVRAIPNS